MYIPINSLVYGKNLSKELYLCKINEIKKLKKEKNNKAKILN